MIVAVVGHGVSPVYKGLGPLVDEADVVVRMWNCDWQWEAPRDYGRKYTTGVVAVRASDQEDGWPRMAAWKPSENYHGIIYDLDELPRYEKRSRQAEVPFSAHGATSKKFTRGTNAVLACLVPMRDGDELRLLGFDSHATLRQGSYHPDVTRRDHNTHSPEAERDTVARLAADRGVRIRYLGFE